MTEHSTTQHTKLHIELSFITLSFIKKKYLY